MSWTLLLVGHIRSEAEGELLFLLHPPLPRQPARETSTRRPTVDGATTINPEFNPFYLPALSEGRTNIPKCSNQQSPSSSHHPNPPSASSSRSSGLWTASQHNLQPWEISVFEPADFSLYGVGDQVGNTGSTSADWLTGIDHFGLDVPNAQWSESLQPPQENAFDFTQVFQNDIYDNMQQPATTSSSAFPLSSVAPSYSPVLPATHSPSPGSQSPDSSGTQTNSRKRASPPVDSSAALKRQRNNVAAKKYRQKKIDRITELEMELKGVRDERDDLKIRLARQEAEASALRSMLRMKAGSDK
ncbi:Basic-leucine zipper (bZIP) transcription factor [Apiospora rasikravindrae]|uniref:Basic-leucine zipper (BZIP) transcription factor n=1 Tax=Apiospora rasikravindrae TaxID=990691 RepID=A0ABR1SX63_9PEZI